MNDRLKLLSPFGFIIGLLTGVALGLAIDNSWIGLGAGVIIGLLIAPMYKDEKRKTKIREGYLLTLVLVGLVLILGAVALTLAAI